MEASSQKAITADLSRRLESWMARRYHLWASEVYLSAYLPQTVRKRLPNDVTGDIRPDYLAFSPYIGNQFAEASWVERGKFTAFEIKTTQMPQAHSDVVSVAVTSIWVSRDIARTAVVGS